MKLLNFLEKPYKSWFPKRKGKILKKIDSIEVDIVSHCNLNCKSCTHFSPIAEPWYIDINDFFRDIQRAHELIPDDKLGCLYILGGEPLLHPQIAEILEIARSVYTKIPVIIITNGFLLDKMDEKFWKICESAKIEIEITKYPVQFDYKRISSCIKTMKGKVKIVFKGRTKIFKKKQYKLPIDITGQQNGEEGFRRCFMAGHCINLSKGHLYTCSYAAFMDRFNTYYNKAVPITEKDGIDIFQSISTKEVLRRLSSPIPLCNYCAVNDRIYGNRWGTSKKEYEEWALDNEQ